MENSPNPQQAPVEAKKYDLEAERQKWSKEFGAAKKWLEKWKEQAKRIDAIIRDERESAGLDESRWPLFAANCETKAAMLYGRPPSVSVERRFADETDKVGRLAGTMLTRLLNTDVERASDGFASALGYALSDRLQCGWAMARARYVVKWEDVPEVPAVIVNGVEAAPAVPASRRKTFEDAETDYIHWADQLWQPSRHFHEMGWWSQKIQMGEEEVTGRWGAEVAKVIPYSGKPPVMSETDNTNSGPEWKRADIWEIWDKDRRLVCWYVEGYGVLECKEDPYGLEGFYPFPRPMVANATTSKLQPRPDYVIAQDLYEELNVVTTRIKKMVEAVRVSGVYGKEFKEVEEVLEKSGDGRLIPVANWGALSEAGGMKNVVQFFPVEEVVRAILQLRDYRRELIDAIGQVTGMADLMRGEATKAGTTATESRVKTRMGSVRMQALQDDFARFASELQQIRAQLVAKFFEPETIAQRANAQFLPDQELIPQALELIKSPAFSQFRIEVKSEAISMTDFAALKADRFEAIAALGQLFNMVAPIAQAMGPSAMPFILKMGQWGIAGMRGASTMEAGFDQVVSQAEQAAQQQQAQPPQPDPKMIAEQMKMQASQMKIQGDLQKEQLKHEQRLQQINAEVVADDQREQSQASWNVREAAQKAAITRAMKPIEPPKPGGMP